MAVYLPMETHLKINKETAEKETTADKKQEYLLKEFDTYRAYDEMKNAEKDTKDTEEYKKAKNKWLAQKQGLNNMWKDLPENAQEEFMSFGRKDVEEAVLKIKKESTPSEETGRAEAKSLKIDRNHPDFYNPWKLKPEEMTVEEIQLQIDRARGSGFLPGHRGGAGTVWGSAYWEKYLKSAQKGAKETKKSEKLAVKEAKRLEKERLEKEEANKKIEEARLKAEAEKEKAEEFEKKNAELIQQMEERNPEPEKEKEIKNQIKEAEKEKKKYWGGWGSGFKKSVSGFYKEASKKSKDKWPFWRERLKGTATAGWLEFYHAEKFRKGTKEVGKETAIQEQLVEKENYVDFESLKNRLIDKGVIKEGQEWSEANIKHLKKVSDGILADKIEYNAELEDQIVKNTLSRLQERLAKYISTGGTKWSEGIPSEKLQAVEGRLREELRKLRNNQIEKDVVDYTKLYRDTFDEGESGWSKWKMRYVYGGLEAALFAVGIKLVWPLVLPYFEKAEKAFIDWWSPLPQNPEVPPLAPAPFPAPGTGEQITPMHDTIWKTVKELGVENGVSLNNNQLVELSKQVAQNPNNHIGVKIWHVLGNPLDTMMKQGYLLDMKEALKGILKLKAGGTL